MPSGTIFFHRLFLHFDYFLALFSAFSRANSSSASMASLVKELLNHQLTSADTVVKPVEMSCSSWVLSMGSRGLPREDSTWLIRASASTAVREYLK